MFFQTHTEMAAWNNCQPNLSTAMSPKTQLRIIISDYKDVRICKTLYLRRKVDLIDTSRKNEHIIIKH